MGPKPHVGRGPHSAEHVVIAREAARRLAPEHRPQRTFRSGRRDFAYREACKLGGHRVKAARLALSFGAFTALGEGQEPESSGSHGRRPEEGLGALKV
jgi:hypothetical protein